MSHGKRQRESHGGFNGGGEEFDRRGRGGRNRGGWIDRNIDEDWETRRGYIPGNSRQPRGRGVSRGGPDSAATSTALCKFWTINGDCRKVPDCRFRHDLRLITRIQEAHDKGIYSMCSVTFEPTDDERLQYGLQPGTTLVDLYTASQDKTVKRWTLFPDPNNTDASCPKLQIRLSSTHNVGACCLAVFYGQGCLICGLNNGDIKVFERESGNEMVLKGHTSEVHSVKLIDNVLISGDWKGRLILWKPDPVQKSFVLGASLDIESPITCFIEVSGVFGSDEPCSSTRFVIIPCFYPVPLLIRHLWVGCTGSVKIVDLLTLTLVRTVRIPPGPNATTPPVVMSLLRLENHVLCCLLGGGVKVFNALDAEEVAINGTKKKHFCSMTGSHSQDGPVVLCGAPHGFVYVLSLPGLDEKLQFCQHSKDVRAVHNIGGTPSFFATASMDGSLNVWYWCRPTPQ